MRLQANSIQLQTWMALLAQEGATARIVRIARPENRAAFGDSADQGQNVPLNSEIAQRFLQLDFNGFGRVGRYEAALWRQVYQVIFVLDVLRRQSSREPRINDRNLKIGKMSDVSGRQCSVARQRNAGNLGVTHVHGSPTFLPRGCQRCRFGRRGAVEIQDTIFQVLPQESVKLQFESLPPPT